MFTPRHIVTKPPEDKTENLERIKRKNDSSHKGEQCYGQEVTSPEKRWRSQRSGMTQLKHQKNKIQVKNLYPAKYLSKLKANVSKNNFKCKKNKLKIKPK